MTHAGEKQIVIAGMGSISAIGANVEDIAEWYGSPRTHGFSRRQFPQGESWVARVCDEGERSLHALAKERAAYGTLDRSVLLAMHAARQAVAMAGWSGDDSQAEHAGVCVGSSRGATGLFEAFHQQHLDAPAVRLGVLASPTTTLGNISSWVADDCRIGERGIACEQSVTCSSGLHAIGTAVAWLRAGMATRFLAGAAEAPLTSFTLAQMQALRLVSSDHDGKWPCRPCAADARNTMILGEGAGMLALEAVDAAQVNGRPRIVACGFAREAMTTNTGISTDGQALATAMRGALQEFGGKVDAVVLHAPGTTLGDEPELRAVRAVFEADMPVLVSNKWLLGHTLGASGVLSLGLALHMLGTQTFPEFPYASRVRNHARPIRSVMVNATGFGSNAASVIVA